MRREHGLVDVIRSKKHPGAVFLKVSGSEDDFILKLYPGHGQKTAQIVNLLNLILEAEVGNAQVSRV